MRGSAASMGRTFGCACGHGDLSGRLWDTGLRRFYHTGSLSELRHIAGVPLLGTCDAESPDRTELGGPSPQGAREDAAIPGPFGLWARPLAAGRARPGSGARGR